LPGKLEFFDKLAGENRILFCKTRFLTRIYDPQISNPIDAADVRYAHSV